MGGTQKKQFKGRIIIATNRDLAQMEKEGKFRNDLYRRLLVFVYEFAPIRADKVRLKNIVNETWRKFCQDVDHFSMRLSQEAWSFLLNYHWKGNIREIRNCLRFVVEMASAKNVEEVTLQNFPDLYTKSENDLTDIDEKIINSLFRPSYYDSLNNFERLYFQDTLKNYGGRVNDTAKMMGISKVTLINKAKKYNINTKLIKALHQSSSEKRSRN